MIRSSLAALAGLMLACAVASAQSRSPAFAPRDETPEQFPAGAGRDAAFYACTACHGFQLVAQQGMGRTQWEDSIDWMTKRHNMPPLAGKERKVIVEYLAATFPARTTGQGNWKNPFAK
jgi:mono/diheme cytochrome c family protein